MQGGLSTADRIVAVSPGYAYEIQTQEGGWGLEGMISSRNFVLSGVLNGTLPHPQPT
jgi:starch synthase